MNEINKEDKRKKEIEKVRERAQKKLEEIQKMPKSKESRKFQPRAVVKAKIPIRISPQEKNKLRTIVQEKKKNMNVEVTMTKIDRFEGKIKIIKEDKKERKKGLKIDLPSTPNLVISPKSKKEGPINRRALMERLKETRTRKKRGGKK